MKNRNRIPTPKGDLFQAANSRRAWIQSITGTSLKHIQPYKDPSIYEGNIEDYVGDIRVPMAISGPLLINGSHVAKEYIPIPIATTEGALVSSLKRGARICSRSGGVTTVVDIDDYTSKSPLFICSGSKEAFNLKIWVKQNYSLIEQQANQGTRHGCLVEIEPLLIGNKLHLNFCYKTGDAAGQNMANQCSYLACEWIKHCIQNKPELGFVTYYMEGNFSGDKKANYHNQIKGRGIRVTATCKIPEQFLNKMLRTNKRELTHWINAISVSGHVIGNIGTNVNFANIIAGIFTACGQDIGSVYESSAGIFNVEELDDGILATVYLPSLVIGTVGGGTGLPTQAECLNILGCFGDGKKYRFAEIVAASCLALDLSTAGAYVSGEFAHSHEKFGRNRPTRILDN